MNSIDVSNKSGGSIQDPSIPALGMLAFSWKDGLMIASLIWVNVIATAVNAAVWIILILWSLTGTSRAVRAMILGYVLFSLNPELFSLWPKMWVFRWFLLFSAASRVFFDWNVKECPFPKWLAWFLLFVLVASLSSILKSYALGVSLLKVFAFAIGFFTIVMGISLSSEYNWYRWIYTFWVVLLISSLPLIPLELGYIHRVGFQGILNHPQEYGVFFAIPAAFLTARLFSDREERLSLLHLTWLIPMWVTTILSLARAGVFAAVLAFFVASVVFLFRRLDLENKLVIKPLSAFVSLLILAACVLYFNTIYDAMLEFLTKGNITAIRQGKMSISEAVFASRMQFAVPSMQSFKENPLMGIGFGIASDSKFFRVEKFYGIPITAKIEKGFIFSALLEETGLLGALAFLVFFIAFTKNVIKYGKFGSYMLLFTAFFVTFGEMGFFSPGATGPYIWFCMAISVVGEMKRRNP